jgi:CheY-like chemotaxis protein
MEPPHSVTILLVDDDDGHRELVLRNLRRAGVRNRIDTVSNGNDALDYVFRRGQYAECTDSRELLLLLDINMPGGFDGIEVLRQIKERPETKMIPVIMLTTADDPHDIDRCYELGCSVYLTKASDPSAFVEAIRRLGLMLSVASMPRDPQRSR